MWPGESVRENPNNASEGICSRVMERNVFLSLSCMISWAQRKKNIRHFLTLPKRKSRSSKRGKQPTKKKVFWRSTFLCLSEIVRGCFLFVSHRHQWRLFLPSCISPLPNNKSLSCFAHFRFSCSNISFSQEHARVNRDFLSPQAKYFTPTMKNLSLNNIHIK